MDKITPFLWFDGKAEEAARFYTPLFPNSSITSIDRSPGDSPSGPKDSVLTVSFTLDGRPFTALNGGPDFTFNESISLLITCADQAEVDHYWDKLSEGGEEGPCGWLKDRFGLSWQVCPAGMLDLLNDPDQGRAQRAMKAMLGMKKLDMAALEAAADQT